MKYKVADKTAIEDEEGSQIVRLIPTCATKKRCAELTELLCEAMNKAMTTPLNEAALEAALRRIMTNYKLTLAGKPVRDVDEIFAECESALTALPIPSADCKSSLVEKIKEMPYIRLPGLVSKNDVIAIVRQHESEIRIENDRVCVAGRWYVPEGESETMRRVDDEMVERVAKAIFDSAPHYIGGLEDSRIAARAAIEAINE